MARRYLNSHALVQAAVLLELDQVQEKEPACVKPRRKSSAMPFSNSQTGFIKSGGPHVVIDSEAVLIARGRCALEMHFNNFLRRAAPRRDVLDSETVVSRLEALEKLIRGSPRGLPTDEKAESGHQPLSSPSMGPSSHFGRSRAGPDRAAVLRELASSPPLVKRIRIFVACPTIVDDEGGGTGAPLCGLPYYCC